MWSRSSFLTFQLWGQPIPGNRGPLDSGSTPAGVNESHAPQTWFGSRGVLETRFKCWLMYPLTNTLQCDPNSKDSLWLPNYETMEHDICDLVCFISWHPLWWRADFCLCAFGEQFFPIDAEQCVYSSCHKFHTVNSDKLIVLHNVAKVPTVFCFNHTATKAQPHWSLYTRFAEHISQVDSPKTDAQDVMSTEHGASGSWLKSGLWHWPSFSQLPDCSGCQPLSCVAQS